MTVPYTFGTATTSIPLSNLDANFNTPITLGNTSIYLGNTTTTIGNLTLTNATISSGTVNITNVTVTTANVTNITVTGTANIATGNVTTLTSTSITDSGLTSGRVTYAGASGLLSDSANLVFNGTNLGIGTGVTPNKDITIYKASTDAEIRLQAGTNDLYLSARNAGGQFDIFNASNAGIRLGTNNTEKLIITGSTNYIYTASGVNVGIGTSSPGQALVVSSADTDRTAINLVNTSSGGGNFNIGSIGSAGLWDASAGSLVIRDSSAGVTRVILDASGNLGLGVTPSAWASGRKAIQIGGVANNYFIGSQNTVLGNNAYNDGTNWRYLTSFNASLYTQTEGGQHQWYNAPSGTAGNAITFTQAMTLDASGNLLVGNTTRGGQATLCPDGIVSLQPAISTFQNATSSQEQISFRNPNGVVGTITTSGSATAYNTSSDQRLKTNIVDAPLGNINDIKVRSFDWIADGSHQEYGMIAQELIEVAPYAVSKPENSEEMMGVDYSKLVPMMIKEIQDLKAEVNQLKAKIGV